MDGGYYSFFEDNITLTREYLIKIKEWKEEIIEEKEDDIYDETDIRVLKIFTAPAEHFSIEDNWKTLNDDQKEYLKHFYINFAKDVYQTRE